MPRYQLVETRICGGKNFDEFAQAHQRGPALADVAIEAEGFVLRQDEDAAQIAIDAIGKGDVDDAVDAAEGHGGLGAVARERPQPLALAARQQNADGIAHQGHGLRSPARGRAPGEIEQRHLISIGADFSSAFRYDLKPESESPGAWRAFQSVRKHFLT